MLVTALAKEIILPSIEGAAVEDKNEARDRIVHPRIQYPIHINKIGKGIVAKR